VHHGAVAGGVLLRPVEVAEARVHLLGVGQEHRQVAVGQTQVVVQSLGLVDVPLGDLLAAAGCIRRWAGMVS
jgi:hypothetical protein